MLKRLCKIMASSVIVGMLMSISACLVVQAKEVDIGYGTYVDESIYNTSEFQQQLQDRDETIAKIDAQNTPTNAWYRAGQMLMTPSGFSSASDQDENHVTGFTGHAGIIASDGGTIIEAGKNPAGGFNVHRAYDTDVWALTIKNPLERSATPTRAW